jgi:hypothetical protein
LLNKPKNAFLAKYFLSLNLINFLILIKPFFSELGYQSFGRIWQFHSSWFEFGFVRRSVVATILDSVGIPLSKENPYLAPYIIYSLILICALNYIVFQHRSFIQENFILSLAIFFSPAFFLHLSYTTGNFDVISLVVFYFLINSKKFVIAILLITFGMLNHEIFMLFLPLYIFSEYISRESFSEFFKKSLAITTITFINFYAFMKIAIPKMDQSRFDELMSKKLGVASGKHPFWSGYLELSPKSPLEYQEKYGIDPQVIWENIGFVIAPTLFAILTVLVLFSILKLSRVERRILLLCSLAPFLVSLIFADDYYRYLSLSISGLLIFFLKIFIFSGLKAKPDLRIYLLLFFSILGPLGSGDLSRPFPVLQRIIEVIS